MTGANAKPLPWPNHANAINCIWKSGKNFGPHSLLSDNQVVNSKCTTISNLVCSYYNLFFFKLHVPIISSSGHFYYWHLLLPYIVSIMHIVVKRTTLLNIYQEIVQKLCMQWNMQWILLDGPLYNLQNCLFMKRAWR